MKRLFVLQFLLCLLFAKPVGAYDFYLENGEGDVIYLNDVTMYEFMPQVEVVGGAMSDDGEITIPAKYGKYDIVGISSYAFRSFSSLKKIVLPESLQYIHKGAFESCRALETVVLPEGLFEISSDAFKMCYALKEIRITSSLVSTNAFDYCMNLEKITFAPNVRDVASWAFTNCNKIKTLIFEDGDGELFLGYGGNNNEMTYGLFYGLKLDSIYLGRGLNYNATSIKQLPFYGTGIERPKLEAKASVIPPYWYEGLDADEFVVPENVKIIANNAFEYSNIKKIIFNERLETIGANASKSSNLGEIVQPEVNNLKEIGEYAFQGCRFQKFKLPVGFTEIKPNSFQSCSMLEEMDIPHTVTRIGGYAFYGCHRLKFSGLSENLDSLGAYAFAGTAIESISIPIGVEYIHSGVFNNCDKLVNIELHNGIIGIGSKAFEGCDALESIKIPNNIKEFSERVFQGCTKLKEINVPENLKYIRRNAFDGCKSLLSIELPKQLYELGDYSFRGCGFVSFTFPEKINYLRVGVLQNCKALKSVDFPTVKSDDLGYSLNGTFAGCSSLESITIPQSIKVINENVFEGCTSLKSIRIENSTETMFLYSSDSPDIQLFGDCILKNVYIGRNVGGSATINSSNCSSTPFYGQIKIDTVELGGYMGEISSWLFPNCKIKKLYINDVIKSIKANAFYSTIPDTVVCQGIEPPSMDLGGLADALIYVPNGTGIDYRRYESWNQNLIIDLTDTISTVRVRYPGAIIASFKQSGIMAPGNVTKVRIEGKINDSDWKVLKDDLRHIYYMDLSATIIDSIPSNQFRGDCKINNIILPSSIKKIGSNAFNGCNNLQLEKLYLENCEYVGCGAFANSFIKNYT